MAATLKWDGDELKLGATTMGEVWKHADGIYRYYLGQDDTISGAYERKDDARQDCLNAVRALLKKAVA
jgi:sarcosine oxidase delta subunit